MDNKRRQYLHAMGIETWGLRAGSQQSDTALAVNAEPTATSALIPPEQRPQSRTPTSREQTAPSAQPLSTAGVISAYNWSQLQAAVSHCVACDLHASRKNTVFGEGDPQADWMIIGEAPGADEDKQGEPFVGRAGQLLNKMLQAIGLQREQVFIANILKCRPPNNRDPRPEEVMQCEAYLKRQVELVKPKIILAVGRIAAHNLLKTDSSLAQLRGKCFYYNHSVGTEPLPTDGQHSSSTPVVITYHPAYLLRSPKEKRKAWQDLLFAEAVSRGGMGK